MHTESSKSLSRILLLTALLCAFFLTFPFRVQAETFATRQANTTPAECLFNWAEINYPALFAPIGSPTQSWTVYTYRYYPATSAYLGVNSVNNHVYYLGPDGVLQDAGPLADWAPKAGCQVPQPPPAECLFNWAEKNYPDLFAPIGSPWVVSSIDWTSRYYSVTNAYLRIQSSDTHVYYLGPDGLSQDVGPLSEWTPKASCTPPVANAGPDQTAFVGATVTLDGSASSDQDGSLITYQWTLTQKPAGSQTVLINPTALLPTLSIDNPGTYVVSLVVNDGMMTSDPDTVTVSTVNSPPVANAGTNQNVPVNGKVTLNGSASSDVDGDLLTFSWSFVSKPDGSVALLSDSSAVQPTFTVDKPGSYVVQLIVKDGSVNSPAATVVITTQNSTPVARAGVDQTTFVNRPVTLDGGNSSDADNDTLTYSWSFVSKPLGSGATLSNITALQPSFTVDKSGTYVVQIIVNDGTVDSLTDTVVITTENSRPVANAGLDETLDAGLKKTLNGEASFDADNDPLSYQWSITSKPTGSNPVLSNENTVSPGFIADKPGTYILQLIVFDGSLSSVPDTLVVDVKLPPLSGAIQSSATSGSVPLEVTLNAIPNGGIPPYQFEWDLNGDAAVDDTRKNFVHTFLQRGVFNVTLKIKDSTGNEAIAIKAISVNNLPSVIVSASPDSGSPPLSVEFSATISDIDGIINRYDWDFDGDGVIDQTSNSSANVTHTYQKTGLYNAKLTASDGNGLSNSDTVAISVGSAPQVTASANNLTGVAPFSVNLSGSATDSDGQVARYEWDFDGDKQFDYNSTSSAAITHTYAAGGIYNATLRATDNDGLIDEDSVIISVSGPPTSLPGAYPLSGNAPLKVTFFSDGKDLDGGPEFYDWDFDGNGTYDQQLIASQNTTFTYDQPGTYKATLKVIDDDGLSSTASITITVNESTRTAQGVPVVIGNASPSVGSTPLNTILSSIATDEDGSIVKYEWDFETDGVYDFMEDPKGIELITETIDAGSYAHQSFADFDGDGDLDMVIGNSNGEITYFRNVGDTNVFEFTNQGLIKDGAGATIDVGPYATPYAYDIDGDKDFDLLTGNSNGWVTVLENTGSATTPAWKNNGTLKLAGGTNLKVGGYAVPIVYSAGNDSDWDLLVGDSSGVIGVFENTGSDSFPVWVDKGDLQDSNGVVIDVGSYATPSFVDQDGDGDRDLYVGENQGRILYLQNQGTDQTPVWINQSFLTDIAGVTIDIGSYAAPVVAPTGGISSNDFWIGNSNGELAWYRQKSNNPLAWQLKSNSFNSIDMGSYASPARVDYDGNGIVDLVIGNNLGTLQLILNLGSADRPIFRLGDFLVDELGVNIDVGDYASPAFTDLDKDGDDDLMVGNGSGQFIYYLNTGNSAAPKWTSQGIVKNSAGLVLDTGGDSSPFFNDLDGDGDQDIISGEANGRLYSIQNTGTVNAPVWAAPTIVNDQNNSAIDIGQETKPLITDFNADGKADLLIGTSAGVIYRYENSSTSPPYTWSLQETQLGKIDVGGYAAPVMFNLDGDIDEDLMIGNSSGLIYQQKTYGNVNHTYHVEGGHNATVRVTDNSGKTAVAKVNITALATGYPSLALTANLSEGLVPLNVSFTATAKDSDGIIASYEWDFDGDGTYERTGSAKESFTYTKVGAFNPRVRVTDNEGKQATLSVPLKVNMKVNFSHNAVINPGIGEKSAISTLV